MEIICPECGEHLDPHELHTAAPVIETAEITSAEVEIARINADKEIRLAKIQAGMIESEAIVEAAVEAAHAEGEAAGLREATAPEPVPEPEPVVVVDAPAEPEADIPAPPVAGHDEDHEDREPRKQSRGLGMW
jgi:hypothetical protein